jgi:hypothetical protein
MQGQQIACVTIQPAHASAAFNAGFGIPEAAQAQHRCHHRHLFSHDLS